MNLKLVLVVLILVTQDFFSQITSLTVKMRFEYVYYSTSITRADGSFPSISGTNYYETEPTVLLSVRSDLSGEPYVTTCYYENIDHGNYGGGWTYHVCPHNIHGYPGGGSTSAISIANPVIYSKTFTNSTGFPGYLKLYLQAFEKDAGDPGSTRCTLGAYDDYVESEFLANIDFKSWGPPCTWNGGDWNTTYSNFYTVTNNYGVSVTTYYEYNESDNLTHYWLGELSNNWFAECNWSTKHVPDNNDDVIIPFPLPSTSAVLPRIYANSSANGQAAGKAYCNTIQVESGAKVTIENGAKLNVTQ